MRHNIQSGLFRLALFLVLVAGIFALFPACKSKPETLKIGYIPIAECVQLYVAEEMGFFAQQNLDVELVSLSGGSKILTALNSSSVDLGFSNVSSLILQRSQGSQFFSIFGATYESKDHQNHAILVKSTTNKSSPKEILKGASIAVNTFKNIESLMVEKYLNSIGLNISDVSLVEVPFPRMLPMLEGGDIQAASIVEPFITIAKDGGTNSIRWLSNHYLSTTPKTLVATYVSSEKIAETKKKELKSFILAMEQATEFIRSNEGQSREIIGRYTKIPGELLAKIGLPEFENKIDANSLDAIISDMKRFGYLDNLRIPTKDELLDWK